MQFRLLTAVTGCTLCPFHLAVCAWMTKLSELLWVYASELNFVNLISVHAAPTSTRKARTVSPANAVPAEKPVITH